MSLPPPQPGVASSGRDWRVVDSPLVTCQTYASAVDTYAELNDVTATGPRDAWAVGTCGPESMSHDNVGRRPTGIIEHWDGSSWRLVHTQAECAFASVAAGSANDVWVANESDPPGDPAGRASGGCLLHWDGHRWTQVSQPVPGDANAFVDQVKGAHGNVWALGGWRGRESLLRETADGWQPVRFVSDRMLQDTTGRLAVTDSGAVWALAPDYSYMDHPRQVTFLHYDGHSWSSVRFPARPVRGSVTNAELVAAGTDVWVNVAAQQDFGNNQPLPTVLGHWGPGRFIETRLPRGARVEGMGGDGRGGLWLDGSIEEFQKSPMFHWDGRRLSGEPPTEEGAIVPGAYTLIPGTRAIWAVGARGQNGAFIEVHP